MNFVSQRKRVRTLTMPDGTRVKLIEEVTGTSTVYHRVRDEGIDATVCPQPLIVSSRSKL